MTPEFKKQWSDALRSGRYKQHRGGWVDNLDNPLSFCCLSVALKEAGKFDEWSTAHKDYDSKYTASYVAKNLLNLETINNFIKMNDKLQNSFEEIADYIDSQESL